METQAKLNLVYKCLNSTQNCMLSSSEVVRYKFGPQINALKTLYSRDNVCCDLVNQVRKIFKQIYAELETSKLSNKGCKRKICTPLSSLSGLKQRLH